MTALCGAATGFVSLFLARLGVGVGEAGGSPPTYSIIADYFKPSERARAMGVYVTGAVIGTGGGLMVGGLLGELLGWRLTFMALGLPGILLGVILFFTVREPKRGTFDTGVERAKEAADMRKTLVSLISNTVYVRLSISFAMLTMVGYAMALWLAPTLQVVSPGPLSAVTLQTIWARGMPVGVHGFQRYLSSPRLLFFGFACQPQACKHFLVFLR
jgi:MFS family permease